MKASNLLSKWADSPFKTHTHLNTNQMITLPDQLNFATDSYEKFIVSQFNNQRLKEGRHSVAKQVSINCDQQILKNWLANRFHVIQQSSTDIFGINEAGSAMFTVDTKKWATQVTYIGSPDVVDMLIKETETTFEQNPCYVRWVYDPQYMEYIKMPVNNKHLPFQEMYPYMKEDLESYYERYVESSANVLLLMGNPGTGKTSFLRGMLHHCKQSATLTYHEKILEQDSFFVDWLENDDMFLILEDADNLLLPRKEGNNLMSRFLNMGDGLMGFTKKKLIFTTNLPNVADIDSALTRPGRCFDIMQFRNLDRNESDILCNKIGSNVPDGQSFSVSELFANQRNEVVAPKKSGFGFI